MTLFLHRTESGKYSAYCARALERAVANGGRQCRPSRMEVLSILLKNPHHHSLPHALPVHFLNGAYHVVGFDGSTTVAEFADRLASEAGFRPVAESGFAVFSDDPIEPDVEHAMHPEDKVSTMQDTQNSTAPGINWHIGLDGAESMLLLMNFAA